MKSLRFTGWIQERDVLNEFTLRFGKYAGKDHNDPEIENSWLDYIIRTLPDNDPKLPPAERREIIRRLSDKKFYGKEGDYVGDKYIKRPIKAPRKLDIKLANQPPRWENEPSHQENTPTIDWWLAKAKIKYESLNPGQFIAVYKKSDGDWLYFTLDGSKGQGILPHKDVKDVIESMKDTNGQPIKADNLEKLKEIARSMAPQPIKNGEWVWAKSKTSHEEGLTPGENLGIIQLTDGNWRFISLDEREIEGDLTKEEVAKTIQSVKDETGKTISSRSLKDLRETVEDKERKTNPYQNKIIEEFANTDKNIVINALAGTGKTTTLKRLAKEFKKPNEKWLYLVFNKKNQVEARGKFPDGVDVATSHSFLGKVLRENAAMGVIPESDLPPPESKVNKIGKVIEQDWFKRKTEQLGIPQFANPKGRKPMVDAFSYRVKKLATMAKHYSLTPNASDLELQELIYKYDIDTTLLHKDSQERQSRMGKTPKKYDKEIIEMARDVLKESMPAANEDPEYKYMRDHDDTLWWAAVHADELKWPDEYSVVLADEIQDFNKNQIVMLKKLAETGARIVAVGDPNQAIYRFRGADAKSFQNVENMLKETDKGVSTNELPVNYRSGTNIINHANENTRVNNLQAGKGHEGVVTTHQTYGDAMDKIKSEWDKKGKLKHQTAFISRTNEPLIKTAIELLKNNINFTIIGRDFSEELVKLMKEITKGKDVDIENFVTEFHNYVDKKTDEWEGKPSREDDLKELESTADAFDSVLKYLAENNWKEPKTGKVVRDTWSLKELFKTLFSGLDIEGNDERDINKFNKLDPKKSVVLTTAHRSKGLEFDRVYIKCPDKFNSNPSGNPEEIEQEENAKYVSLTRATHQLHVLDEKCA